MATLSTLTTRRGERGNAMIEFAFVLPLLLVIFAGIVDFGFLFQRYEVITNAAREGARIAVLPGYSSSDVQARVRQYISEGLGMSLADATAATSGSNGSITVGDPSPALVVNGRTIPATTVTVSYRHNYLILGPILGLIGGSWGANTNITATSTMRIEVPATGS